MRVFAVMVIATALLGVGRAAGAAGPVDAASGVIVHAECAPIVAPGRLRCDVAIRIAGDAKGALTLRWADVEVTAAPAFVVPLKGRIGPSDATKRDADAWSFAFAVVARQAGEGDVALRTRVVLCEAGSCTPRIVETTARVVVGGEPLPAPPP